VESETDIVPDGLWSTSYKAGDVEKDTPVTRERELWLTLDICRIMKRFSEDEVKP